MALNEGPIAGRRGIGGVSVDMILVLMAVGLALTFAAVLYVAANVGGLVAHRAWPGLGFNDAVTGLGPVHHPGNPALSFPAGIRAQLPGPVVYWTVAVLMVVVPIGAAQLVWRRSRSASRPSVGVWRPGAGSAWRWAHRGSRPGRSRCARRWPRRANQPSRTWPPPWGGPSRSTWSAG